MMKACRVLSTLVLGGFIATLLSACGGSSGTSPPAAPAALLSGMFIDAPVAGAKYVTSSGSGGCVASAPCTTGAQGQFSYASGDSVTFLAASFTLGTTPALTPAADGTTTVTPVTLVAGATAPTDAGPTAIAQFLQTLSTISAGTSGSGATGVLTLPSDSATTGALTTALNTAGVTATSSITSVVSQLQTAINSAFGANVFTVVPAATAQAALTQGVNSNGIVGTVWTGNCTCNGGGTIYFQPGGVLTGFTSDGSLLAGTWTGSTTAAGGVSVQANASGGGYGTGTIASNASTFTVTVFDRNGATKGTIPFAKLTASNTSPVTNSQYLGGWYATYTPNAVATANGDTGGTAYIVAAPDGTFYGVTDGSRNSFSGTWTVANGQGSASWTDSSATVGKNNSITIDLANANGTVSVGGQAAGTLALSRTGTLTRKNNQSSTGATTPLLLNVAVSWANGSNTVSSLALGLNVFDSTGTAVVASAVKSESTSLNTSGARTTTTDNIAVSYPSGGATYSLSVGSSNCTITNGTNMPVSASTYPTVYVTCDANYATTANPGPPIPLLLNVVTTWGTTYPSPGYGLSLQVKDANGAQIASGFVQQHVNLYTSSGAVVATTTTNNIAASYPTGSGKTYVLSTGSGPGAYCSITSGGKGPVVDNASASAYPTVQVSCP